MLTTTLNAIRKRIHCDILGCSLCDDGWGKLLKSLGKTKAGDEPLPLIHILKSNGIEDAIWYLRAVEGHDREIRLFAVDCAESVLYLFEEKYPNDDRPRKAIEAARKFANGEITEEELDEACTSAARAAGYARAYASARDAVWAARAARPQEREKQAELFRKYFG